MQTAICKLQYANCNIQTAVCNLQHTNCNTARFSSTFKDWNFASGFHTNLILGSRFRFRFNSILGFRFKFKFKQTAICRLQCANCNMQTVMYYWNMQTAISVRDSIPPVPDSDSKSSKLQYADCNVQTEICKLKYAN